MRRKNKWFSWFLGLVPLITFASCAMVACGSTKVATPYNNSGAKYQKLVTVNAKGIFATQTGIVLQNTNSPVLITNLVKEYPQMQINSQTATITQIVYNPGTLNSSFNNGTLQIWINDYASENNSGIVVTINGILGQSDPPLPNPPVHNAVTLFTNNLFPNGGISFTQLQNYTPLQWELLLKNENELPWNFAVTITKVTTSVIQLSATGECSNNQIYHLQIQVLPPPVTGITSTKNFTFTVQQIFGSAITVNAFYQMSDQQIFNALNKNGFHQSLNADTVLDNGQFIGKQLSTTAPLFAGENIQVNLQFDVLHTCYIITLTGFSPNNG